MREGNFHARRRTCRNVEHLTGGWGLCVLSVGHLTLQNAASACSRATRTLNSRNRPLYIDGYEWLSGRDCGRW
jgi:hypothetical protein